MFPNLRLMLSASLATIVLVAIVGSSLVLFRPPPARMADMPEIVRPIMSIADDNRPLQLFDAGTRRNEELQRLLALPPGPMRAYAAEPPAAFPYAVTAASSPAAATEATPAEGSSVAATAPIAVPEPISTPAGPVPTEVQAMAVVAALPEPASQPEPVLQPEPQPVRQPEPTPLAAATEPADPVTTATILSPDSIARAVPETSVPEVETFPVSSIPAVDDAPIPRPKPQLALADPHASAEKTNVPQVKASQPQRAKAKAKPRRQGALSRRVKQPLPPPTPFESQQGQYPFFDNGNGRDGNGRQGNWNGRTDTAVEPASTGRPQRRAYGIPPPTTTSR